MISGYSGPDNYTNDDGLVLEVDEYETVEEVEQAYADFKEDTDDDDYSRVTFRVIEGKERKMAAVEKVTKYKME